MLPLPRAACCTPLVQYQVTAHFWRSADCTGPEFTPTAARSPQYQRALSDAFLYVFFIQGPGIAPAHFHAELKSWSPPTYMRQGDVTHVLTLLVLGDFGNDGNSRATSTSVKLLHNPCVSNAPTNAPTTLHPSIAPTTNPTRPTPSPSRALNQGAKTNASAASPGLILIGQAFFVLIRPREFNQPDTLLSCRQ